MRIDCLDSRVLAVRVHDAEPLSMGASGLVARRRPVRRKAGTVSRVMGGRDEWHRGLQPAAFSRTTRIMHLEARTWVS